MLKTIFSSAIAFAALAVLSPAGFAQTPNPAGSMQGRLVSPSGHACAEERARCAFTGTATVYYGAGSRWVAQVHRDGVACANQVFGDPNPGVVKSCYVSGESRPALAIKQVAIKQFAIKHTAPSTHRVTLRSTHGKYVVAEPTGHANANRGKADAWEHWQLISNANNTVSFKSAHGRFLVAEADGRAQADRVKAGAWEQWQLTRNADGTVSLRSHHGKYLVAEKDGSLNANRDNLGPWERFVMTVR